jgi:hypothetical protein
MAAGHRDGIDGFDSQFIGDLLEVRRIATTQITRLFDGIEHFASNLLREYQLSLAKPGARATIKAQYRSQIYRPGRDAGVVPISTAGLIH